MSDAIFKIERLYGRIKVVQPLAADLEMPIWVFAVDDRPGL